MSQIFLTIPGDLAFRELSMRPIESMCKLAGVAPNLDPDELSRFSHALVSAVGEAFNNVILHSYKDGHRGKITLIVNNFVWGLQVEMQDTGKTFDPSTIPEPDLDSLPESGMGLFIIRSFVDELEYHPGAPNRLVLKKSFNLKPASASTDTDA